MNLIQKFKAWRKDRYWAARHKEFIRRMVLNDLRWLSVDPTCREIMERYEKITSHFWYKISHEDISNFRRRIGKDVHWNERVGLEPTGNGPLDMLKETP